MSCENYEQALRQAQARHLSLVGNATIICSSQGGYNSDACRQARAAANEAIGAITQATIALQKCRDEHPEVPTSRLLGVTGYVTFLRVNEPGSGYGGGSTNWFDADVIFKLHSRPDKGFGFQLRDDAAEPVRRGMLSLLEDAIVNRLQVITDYIELAATPNDNCFVIRVALIQTPPQRPVGLIEEMLPE